MGRGIVVTGSWVGGIDACVEGRGACVGGGGCSVCGEGGLVATLPSLAVILISAQFTKVSCGP